MLGFLERLQILLEHQNFCHSPATTSNNTSSDTFGKVPSEPLWPSLNDLHLQLAARNQSCQDACQHGAGRKKMGWGDFLVEYK